MQRVLLIASGRVQGVGFREFARRIGTSCKLTGYAKNLPDGTVELLAEGEEENISQFRRRVSARMPLGIQVEKLETKKEGKIEKPEHATFSIKY
jgi:acylphosphatase